jgi:hypothetical protein
MDIETAVRKELAGFHLYRCRAFGRGASGWQGWQTPPAGGDATRIPTASLHEWALPAGTSVLHNGQVISNEAKKLQLALRTSSLLPFVEIHWF